MQGKFIQVKIVNVICKYFSLIVVKTVYKEKTNNRCLGRGITLFLI